MLRGMSNSWSADVPHIEATIPTGQGSARPASPSRSEETRRGGQRSSSQSLGKPRVRRGSVRLPSEIAWRLRAGHPWVYRDTLGGRPLREAAGDVLELYEAEGNFIARGIYDPEGP